MQRLLNPKEAAAYLSLSRDTLYEYIRFGIIPKVSLPALPGHSQLRKVLIDKQDLDKFIDNGKPLQTRENMVDEVISQRDTLPGVYKKGKEVRRKDRNVKAGDRVRVSLVQHAKETLRGAA